MVEAFSFENDEVISNVNQCMCTKIVRFLEAGSRPYSTTKSIRYEVVQISNGKAVRRKKKKEREIRLRSNIVFKIPHYQIEQVSVSHASEKIFNQRLLIE